MRIILAFLLAPAALPIAYLVYLGLTGSYGQADGVVVFGSILPLSYVAVFGLGLPTHLLLRWSRETGIVAYLVWGLLLAVVAPLVDIDNLIGHWHPGGLAIGQAHSFWLVTMFGPRVSVWTYGAVSGVLFWLIVRPDRPGAQSRHKVQLEWGHRSAP